MRGVNTDNYFSFFLNIWGSAQRKNLSTEIGLHSKGGLSVQFKCKGLYPTLQNWNGFVSAGQMQGLVPKTTKLEQVCQCRSNVRAKF